MIEVPVSTAVNSIMKTNSSTNYCRAVVQKAFIHLVLSNINCWGADKPIGRKQYFRIHKITYYVEIKIGSWNTCVIIWINSSKHQEGICATFLIAQVYRKLIFSEKFLQEHENGIQKRRQASKLMLEEQTCCIILSNTGVTPSMAMSLNAKPRIPSIGTSWKKSAIQRASPNSWFLTAILPTLTVSLDKYPPMNPVPYCRESSARWLAFILAYWNEKSLACVGLICRGFRVIIHLLSCTTSVVLSRTKNTWDPQIGRPSVLRWLSVDIFGNFGWNIIASPSRREMAAAEFQ